jgi:shikimate dehydrogenase
MDRYAVIGQPVAHSLSPTIHRLFAEQTGQTLSYDKLPAPADDFAGVAEEFFAAGGQGLNVTVPFKSTAAHWVHTLDSAAQAAGAVNTIAVKSGRFRGYNTDGVGLTTDLGGNHGCEIAGKAVLVLGAGGAVKGVARPLMALGPRTLTIANRTVQSAQALAAQLSDDDQGVEVIGCGLNEPTGGYDVVINGTSAGLEGQGAILAESAVRGAFCYDMLYKAGRDTQTPFCSWALDAGAMGVCDGLGMLVEQAAEAFWIWRGVRPETAPVLERLAAPDVLA